jgi:GTPase SAR1 family protein
MVLYSVISPSSLSNVVQKWCPEIKHHCPNAPWVLVGTKSDLEDDASVLARLAERNHVPVSQSAADDVATRFGAAAHVRVSALTRHNVKLAFDSCVRAVISPAKPAKAGVRGSKAAKGKGKCTLF